MECLRCQHRLTENPGYFSLINIKTYGRNIKPNIDEGVPVKVLVCVACDYVELKLAGELIDWW